MRKLGIVALLVVSTAMLFLFVPSALGQPPTVASAKYVSPSSWVTCSVFDPGDTVCVVMYGFSPSTSYDVEVVSDVAWSDGMSIPSYVVKTAVVTDFFGDVSDPVAVWSGATPGKYDIIVDVNRNGVYDVDVDALDGFDVEGFLVVPEYLLGTLLGLAGCVGALGVFRISRRK